jgi:hypothetical protein
MFKLLMLDERTPHDTIENLPPLRSNFHKGTYLSIPTEIEFSEQSTGSRVIKDRQQSAVNREAEDKEQSTLPVTTFSGEDLPYFLWVIPPRPPSPAYFLFVLLFFSFWLVW